MNSKETGRGCVIGVICSMSANISDHFHLAKTDTCSISFSTLFFLMLKHLLLFDNNALPGN